ncbi:MAG TPA: alpha/beta hydrolase [Candidatus Saccharimonadales bacterium]|nr:alpha/beta hydrolase [Candidatus Saccharimonadales bacterium]
MKRREPPRRVKYADREGYQLEIEETGDSSGAAVVLQHGMPGHNGNLKPSGQSLYRGGIRLVAYSRPGYPGSTRRKGRNVADAANDVRAIAAELDLGRYALVGRSVGAAHALACAALIPPEELAVVYALAPPTPPDRGLWTANMAASNQVVYDTDDDARIAALIQLRADRVSNDPSSLLRMLEDELPLADRKLLGSGGLRQELLRCYAASVGQDRGEEAGGWIDDAVALTRPWGVSLNDINANGVPIHIWAGEDDVFAPVEQIRAMARQLHNATLTVGSSQGHFSAVEEAKWAIFEAAGAVWQQA